MRGVADGVEGDQVGAPGGQFAGQGPRGDLVVGAVDHEGGDLERVGVGGDVEAVAVQPGAPLGGADREGQQEAGDAADSGESTQRHVPREDR